MPMTKLKIGSLLTLSTLFISSISTVYATDKTPVVSYEFDNNNSNISAYTNTDGTLTEVIESVDFTYRAGQLNECIYLDGTYGLRLDTDGLTTDNYTIAFWVKPSEITALTPIMSLVQGEFADNIYASVILDKNLFQPNITGIYTDNSDTLSYSCGVPGALNSSVWTHIAIVVNSSDNDNIFDDMKLYIDGTYMCDGKLPKKLLSDNSSLWIGVDTSENTFVGCIDEFYIYDDALSNSDISSIYKLSSPNNDESSTEEEPSTEKPTATDKDNRPNRPDGNKHNHSNNSQSGNIFDDITEIEQGSLSNTDSSSISTYLNPGLAAGMEYKTNVYSDIAFTFSIILAGLAICLLLTYTKKKRNQY